MPTRPVRRVSFLAHEPAVAGRGAAATTDAGGAGLAVAEQAAEVGRFLARSGAPSATVTVVAPRPAHDTARRRGAHFVDFEPAEGSLDDLAAKYPADPVRLARFRELLGDAPVLAHHLPAALVARALGLPTLVTLHSLWPWVRAELDGRPPGPRAPACETLLESASAVLVGTAAERTALLRTAPPSVRGGDLARRVVVVGQGASPWLVRLVGRVDPSRLRRAWRTRLLPGSTYDDVVFYVVGRLVPYKRVFETIESFLRVASALPRARLLVVGPPTDAAYAARCLAAIREAPAGVGSRVVLAGPLRLDAAHLAGDVLVHPSRFETWGRAIDEAAVVGRPAVLGHTPFVAARLGNDAPDRALWIDADDPGAFDDALRRAGLDAAWRARCGERARRSATQLGWDGPLRALLSAWNDVEFAASGFRPFALPDLHPGAAPCVST